MDKPTAVIRKYDNTQKYFIQYDLAQREIMTDWNQPRGDWAFCPGTLDEDYPTDVQAAEAAVWWGFQVRGYPQCRCGHLLPRHEHYRRGTDCSCRGCECRRYRGTRRAAWLVMWLVMWLGIAAWVMLASAVMVAIWMQTGGVWW
jgi:hypothetical protein